jgi:hypothetical protein
MIITIPGEYKLLESYQFRGPGSVLSCDAGYIVDIRQIDKSSKKVIGPDLPDWVYWDLPVVPVDLGEPVVEGVLDVMAFPLDGGD